MAAANVFELMASATADDNRELIAQMTDRALLSYSCYVLGRGGVGGTGRVGMDGSSQGGNLGSRVAPQNTAVIPRAAILNWN